MDEVDAAANPELTEDQKRLIAQACFDPGRVVERAFTTNSDGDGDLEPVHRWQSRAVVAALNAHRTPHQ